MRISDNFDMDIESEKKNNNRFEKTYGKYGLYFIDYKHCYRTGIHKIRFKWRAGREPGIFLNQMASVVAYDGDMTEEDREYMNGLLPLENYKDTYRPCVVDLLKWDQNFSQKYLNEHLNGFMKTYISMFIRNPYTYIEAWALNTYGYWALNRWELNTDANNIYKGNLGDIENGENYGIVPHSLLEIQKVDLKSIFEIGDAPVALAILTWFVFLIVLLIIKKQKWGLGLAIAPTLGLAITLFVATPYAYWQRYGLAQYYLVPFYIFIVVYLLKEKKE